MKLFTVTLSIDSTHDLVSVSITKESNITFNILDQKHFLLFVQYITMLMKHYRAKASAC